MNRRVVLVTALSIVGTITVAAASLAVVYQPTDGQSAGVPLLDTSLVPADASASTPVVIDVRAPVPSQPDPASQVAAVAPSPAAPTASGVAARPPTPAAAGTDPTPNTTATTPAVTAPSAPTPAAAPTSPTPPTTSPAQPPSTPAMPATTATTAAPAPTVTTAAPRPEGVPADWPANKPIPPVPANCVQPQLEDNGVWNCQN